MTTPQPAALPELPEPDGFLDQSLGGFAAYTADQMRAYALAALQSQPAAAGVSEAWDEGYKQGVEDERTSEANIGVAGFGAKVAPARQNPYRAAQAKAVDPEDLAAAGVMLMGRRADHA